MMSSLGAGAAMVLSAFLSALSQMMLKRSADKTYKNALEAYLNPSVILSYGILFATMLINMLAYRSLPYLVGQTLIATSYIFVMLLGRMILGEKLTKKKIAGNLLIIVGILIFNWK